MFVKWFKTHPDRAYNKIVAAFDFPTEGEHVDLEAVTQLVNTEAQ